MGPDIEASDEGTVAAVRPEEEANGVVKAKEGGRVDCLAGCYANAQEGGAQHGGCWRGAGTRGAVAVGVTAVCAPPRRFDTQGEKENDKGQGEGKAAGKASAGRRVVLHPRDEHPCTRPKGG